MRKVLNFSNDHELISSELEWLIVLTSSDSTRVLFFEVRCIDRIEVYSDTLLAIPSTAPGGTRMRDKRTSRSIV